MNTQTKTQTNRLQLHKSRLAIELKVERTEHNEKTYLEASADVFTTAGDYLGTVNVYEVEDSTDRICKHEDGGLYERNVIGAISVAEKIVGPVRVVEPLPDHVKDLAHTYVECVEWFAQHLAHKIRFSALTLAGYSKQAWVNS